MLLANFIDYVNDNVITMLMAATVGTLSGSLADMMDGTSVPARLCVQVLLCVAVVSVLRLVCLLMYRNAAAGGKTRRVFGSLLPTLIWFLRVPVIIVLPDYFALMYKAVDWNPAESNAGSAAEAFVLNLVCFVCLFTALLALARIVQSRPDIHAPDTSWATFYLQSAHLGCLSASGKCMHYVIRLAGLTLLGPTDLSAPPTAQFGLMWTFLVLIMTAVCWFFLFSTIPNQMKNPELSNSHWTQLHLSCQEYVMVYTWCFGFVEYGWVLLYGGVGSLTSHAFGFVVFVSWLVVHLVISVVLASGAPDCSFYQMGPSSRAKQTLSMMNFWCVDNITWWVWAQVMTTLDDDVDMATLGLPADDVTKGSWATVLANFAVLLALFFTTAVVRVGNEVPLQTNVMKETLPVPTSTDEDFHTNASSGEPSASAVKGDDLEKALPVLPGAPVVDEAAKVSEGGGDGAP